MVKIILINLLLYTWFRLVTATVPLHQVYDVVRPPLKGSCSPDQIELLESWWQDGAIFAQDALEQWQYLKARAAQATDPDTYFRQRASVKMVAAWYGVRAQDPYEGLTAPDGLTGIFSQPVNNPEYNTYLSTYMYLQT
ncbi:hypothetical protein TWF696_008089 [Orbilia brochopaga]|uniref:Uncharacterized protein n=1 Tax=Orbilia brochopaga TaxID=3140254 RepID=A0AAV9UQH3_9PEZI